MSRRLEIRPQAEADIEDAYAWYERQAPGLGAEFVRAVDAALATVHRNPEMYAPVHEQIRRILLRRFPYGVFYVLRRKTAAYRHNVRQLAGDGGRLILRQSVQGRLPEDVVDRQREALYGPGASLLAGAELARDAVAFGRGCRV